jgi:vitamin B12/bleomycin/antimicrobial peptide transport system ATP-binding/permease protein
MLGATGRLAGRQDVGAARELQARGLLRNFWHGARGFWGKYGTPLSWGLSAALAVIIVLNLATAYGMNVWHRVIFDALQSKEADTVLSLSALYLPLLAGSVLLSVVQLCARMTLQRRWRAWLNDRLIARWLDRSRHYHLNLAGGGGGAGKNPEYRIADDVRIATEAPIEFAIGAATAVLSAATFIVVLWTIGGALTVHVGDATLTIPGFLVIAAVIYAMGATGTMFVIGRRLVTVSESKNQAEAEYRYLLTRVRENAEGIALLKGEDEERRGVGTSFATVLHAWRDVCIQSMRTTIVSQTSGYIAPILPIILCAPKFLDDAMTLGEVMQAASAFAIVQSAPNWLVDNYPRLADWAASARRVASLQASLTMLEQTELRRCSRIDHREGTSAALSMRDTSVSLDDGTPLIAGADLVVMPGEKVLLMGDSGTGKSTLARACAGVWPWGEGEVEIQAGARLLVLPQRPYVPMGTLRRAVTYPDAANSRTVAEITRVLEKVELGHLADRLDEDAPWDQTLSGGEKQRLAFARLFLHRPGIVVLDEATAALDPAGQDRLMALLSEELAHATVLSIGHRPELARFHQRKIVLRRGRDGAKLVSEVVRPSPFKPKPAGIPPPQRTCGDERNEQRMARQQNIGRLPMTIHSIAICASATVLASALMVIPQPAQALTMKECSAKYQAAKTGGTLAGQSWRDFRKAQCGADATAAAPAATTPAATTPAAPPTAAPAAAKPPGNAVFPTAVSPKYSSEAAGKARMHTCLDQYNANKATNANGGLRWIQKGGGYYSECTKQLKG